MSATESDEKLESDDLAVLANALWWTIITVMVSGVIVYLGVEYRSMALLFLGGVSTLYIIFYAILTH